MGSANHTAPPPGAPGGAIEAAAAAAPAPGRSRVVRFDGRGFAWEGVARREYKSADGTWTAVSRQQLVGGAGESCTFHLRYFEVAPGGHTTLERHRHEHVVVVLRGHGEVELAGRREPLAFGDLVWVAPHEPHRFRNAGSDPFGFLCTVDAERDRPEPLAEPAAPPER